MNKKEDAFEKYAPRFFSVFLIVLIFGVFSIAKRELKSDFDAIHYLEKQGYSSVRILQQTPKGHGCQPEDVYHFLFEATSPQGRRIEDVVCFDGTSWYEE